jgi:hypothetical protein
MPAPADTRIVASTPGEARADVLVGEGRGIEVDLVVHRHAVGEDVPLQRPPLTGDADFQVLRLLGHEVRVGDRERVALEVLEGWGSKSWSSVGALKDLEACT